MIPASMKSSNIESQITVQGHQRQIARDSYHFDAGAHVHFHSTKPSLIEGEDSVETQYYLASKEAMVI